MILAVVAYCKPIQRLEATDGHENQKNRPENLQRSVLSFWTEGTTFRKLPIHPKRMASAILICVGADGANQPRRASLPKGSKAILV